MSKVVLTQRQVTAIDNLLKTATIFEDVDRAHKTLISEKLDGGWVSPKFTDASGIDDLVFIDALRKGYEVGEECELSITTKIENWAIDRNLHTADPMKQALKLGEEYGELCQGLAKGKFEDTKDAIGDMVVVLIIMSMQLETSVEDCMNMAYNEIKDRKGKMVNGVFVKESDL